MPSQIRVLYCHCAHAQVLSKAVKETVLRKLCESGLPFVAAADLCGMAAHREPVLRALAAIGALKIAACYPRAIQWLFAAAQVALPKDSVQVLNLRTASAEEASAALLAPGMQPNLPTRKTSEPPVQSSSIPNKSQHHDGQPSLQIILYEGPGTARLSSEERFASVSALLEKGYTVACASEESEIGSAKNGPVLVLGRFKADAGLPNGLASDSSAVRFQHITGADAARIIELAETRRTELGARQPGAWMPWFPVIDYDRCTHCMSCLSFCLFGVFGVDGQKRIAVQSSEQCKTNCPACSRVCPEAAIIFPKYPSGPINGDAINEAALDREKMKIDVSALLGGDIYQMLRDRSERSQSRFSTERDSKKALQERQRCLAKLLQGANIPPEVLAALPSPEEIQRKAAEALAKAQAALQSVKPSTNGSS